MRQADWDQGIPFEIMGDIFKLAPGSINAARQVSTTWRAGANQFITKIKVAYSERPKETDPPPITGAALNARFSRITHLDIGESKLAPAELEDLAPGCTKVTNLTLGARKSPGKNFPHTIESKPPEFPKGILAVRVRTEGLQFLQNFQVLRCLDLRGCTSLADAGLQRMAGLHLDELVIVRSKHLTDFGMVHLSGMMTLKRLTLEQITKLTADGVRCLRGLELVWLSLRGCISLKNDTVSVLNEMRTLEHLSLEGCHGLDTRCLAPLSGPNPEGPPKKLTSLNLGLLAKPTVNCLRSLLSTNAPPLKYLYLDGCTDMHGGYRTFKSGEFANVLDLEELSVARWTYWDDESMKSVANLYKLTSFNVEGCRRLTAAGLVHLKGKKLKKLDLRRCNMLTAAGIEHLRGMPLEWLYLRRCVELTDAALEHLRDMRLRELDLRRCTKITDEGLKWLVGMPLRYLDLGHCTRVTDAGMVYLRGMPLEYLVLVSLTAALTPAGLQNVRDAPLVYLDVRLCPGLLNKEGEGPITMKTDLVTFKEEVEAGGKVLNVIFQDPPKVPKAAKKE